MRLPVRFCTILTVQKENVWKSALNPIRGNASLTEDKNAVTKSFPVDMFLEIDDAQSSREQQHEENIERRKLARLRRGVIIEGIRILPL